MNVELVHTKSLPLYISYDSSFMNLNFDVLQSYVKSRRYKIVNCDNLVARSKRLTSRARVHVCTAWFVLDSKRLDGLYIVRLLIQTLFHVGQSREGHTRA